MSQLRIFSYLPNPRIWKATIAARLCGVEIEIRGAPPTELQSWLWDFDARPLSAADESEPAGEQIGRTGFKGVKLRKTSAFLEAHPFGTVPAAFSPDGKIGIFESNSIMRAVARLGESRFALYGCGPYEASRVDSSTRVSSSLAMRNVLAVAARRSVSPRFNREPRMLSPPISAGSAGRSFRSATSWSARGSLSPTSASSPSSHSSRTSEHGETCSNDEASRRSSTG